MEITNFYLAIFLGLCLSLIIEIKLGISPGGVIVPSYMALVIDDFTTVISIFLVAIATFLLVKYVISRFMLIYGKRRFIACVMSALLIKGALALLYPLIPFSVLAFNGLGVVMSGIIANCYFKQGPAITTGATLVTSFVVFATINLTYLF